MRGLVRSWLGMWRPRPVSILSPLLADVAAERIRAGLGANVWRRSAGTSVTVRLVRGRVSVPNVQLTAFRLATRNSWRPVLRARLVPAQQGCVLVGTIGSHPAVRAFTTVWLAGVGGFVFLGLVATVWFAVTGDFVSALKGLGFAGVASGLGACGVILFLLGGRWGAKDEQFLREWLERRLAVAADRDVT